MPCVEPKLEPVMVNCPFWAIVGEIEVIIGDKLDEYVKLMPVVL